MKTYSRGRVYGRHPALLPALSAILLLSLRHHHQDSNPSRNETTITQAAVHLASQTHQVQRTALIRSPADLPGRALTSYPWQPISGEPSRRHAWSWAAHGATQSNSTSRYVALLPSSLCPLIAADPDLDCAYRRVTVSPIATQKDGTSTNNGTETVSRNGGVQDDGKLTRFVSWHAAK